jgi:hypothetical protein
MAVYVDNSRLSWRGKLWCHLVADSLDELHTFAHALGLKRDWFQHKTRYPHYDVTISIREKALKLGAIDGDKAIIVAKAKQLRLELVGLSPRRSESEGELCSPRVMLEAQV